MFKLRRRNRKYGIISTVRPTMQHESVKKIELSFPICLSNKGNFKTRCFQSSHISILILRKFENQRVAKTRILFITRIIPDHNLKYSNRMKWKNQPLLRPHAQQSVKKRGDWVCFKVTDLPRFYHLVRTQIKKLAQLLKYDPLYLTPMDQPSVSHGFSPTPLNQCWKTFQHISKTASNSTSTSKPAISPLTKRYHTHAVSM